MAQGEKVFKSVQARGLANARKELQKNLWSFQTHRCLKSILVSGRFCLTCTRQKSRFLREKVICTGPLAEWVLPSLVGEVNKKKS